MRKWMKERLRRRKRKSGAGGESESTGKVGQARPTADAQPEPLQPDYLEAFAAQKSPAEEKAPPPPPKVEVEMQPENPSAPPAPAADAIGHAPQKKPKGVVVLAIGLPGSGKTTWFRRRGVTPLSSDLLRSVLFDDVEEQRYQGLVFSTLRSLLRARLIARMPWNYVDATNLSPRERRQWIHMARSLGYEVHAVFFDVPLEVCLERNRHRDRLVPEDVLRRMAGKLRPPKFEEGFAKIVVVRVKKKSGDEGPSPDE
jgi:predicted kinase